MPGPANHKVNNVAAISLHYWLQKILALCIVSSGAVSYSMVCQVGLEPTIQVARGLKPRVYTHSTTSTYGGSAQGRTADCSVMSQVFYQLNYRTIFIVQQDSLLSCPLSYELLYVTIKIRPDFFNFRFAWTYNQILLSYILYFDRIHASFFNRCASAICRGTLVLLHGWYGWLGSNQQPRN